MPLKRSADENSTEITYPQVKIMDTVQNFIATEHIYIDIPANSAQISVKYSLLHVPCPDLMDVLCAYGVTWIKTEGAFHSPPQL